MAPEITFRRRLLLTALLTATSVLAIVSWSESRSTAAFAAMSLAHGRSLAQQDEAKVFRQFEREVDAVRSSMTRTTAFAVLTLVLSFATFVALWLPKRQEEEPNKAPEPTPMSVTPRATEGDLI